MRLKVSGDRRAEKYLPSLANKLGTNQPRVRVRVQPNTVPKPSERPTLTTVLAAPMQPASEVKEVLLAAIMDVKTEREQDKTFFLLWVALLAFNSSSSSIQQAVRSFSDQKLFRRISLTDPTAATRLLLSRQDVSARCIGDASLVLRSRYVNVTNVDWDHQRHGHCYEGPSSLLAQKISTPVQENPLSKGRLAQPKISTAKSLDPPALTALRTLDSSAQLIELALDTPERAIFRTHGS
uniref:Uncharacterized protein n=1 Tax=Ascaris lumbricoides TaxID=6252 RepID=A0A0M3HQU5_ASCLU